MATYEEIYGKRVKEFDSDPTLDSSYEGQVWYNTGDGVLKTLSDWTAWTDYQRLASLRSAGQYGGRGTPLQQFKRTGDNVVNDNILEC